MNRRNFFKVVTGFVAGMVAAFVPKIQRKRILTKEEIQLALNVVVADKMSAQKPYNRDGLDEAFCYGGKLFRVFRGYIHDDFTMIQLREGKWENRQMLQNSEFANLQYRHLVCEYMLQNLEKKLTV